MLVLCVCVSVYMSMQFYLMYTRLELYWSNLDHVPMTEHATVVKG